MAQRRMFSKEITTSDKFVDMPQSTRLLYYDLGMEADDEGFIGNARMLSRAYGANIDDLKLLQAKGFIIIFESGVTVVKDWNVNNKIRKDRIKPTIYTDERSLLSLDNNGVYQLDNQVTTKWQPNDNQMSAQYRIGKDRIGKDRIGEDSGGYNPPPKSNLNFGQFIRAEGLKANDNHIQRLLDYIGLEGMDMDLVKLAVIRTTEQGIVAPAYTFSILDNWKKKGFTTVEQANKEQEEFEQQKSKTSTTAPQKTNVPEWSNPDYKAPDLDSLKVEVTEDYSDDPTAF
ncbi:DnaD domain-containing protein [Streptococcus thoraltensis]|uniref:DnaD domain-containing protein n=1 Tax=Streptococcus thoraltensis TaxID=55085 RepID=UPI000362375F|nr:DnaD domain protein [Streptococcus thoraltensis]